MALMKGSEPWAMTADGAARRRGYAAESELALRNGLELFARERWPDARICHECVMGEGRVRADVIAVTPDHFVAFEVKGSSDDCTRLLHQVGMFQLTIPEVWMVVDDSHMDDAKLIRHLLPSVGLLTGKANPRYWGNKFMHEDGVVKLDVLYEAEPRDPVPEMLVAMMWAAEQAEACRRTKVLTIGKKLPARRVMEKALLAALGPKELLREACHALRGRDAVWRADEPITGG